MTAVIEGLQRDHRLLAAYLEATDKIEWRALQKRVPISAAPITVAGVGFCADQQDRTLPETYQASGAPQLPEVVPLKPSFIFRRANLVRAT